MKKNLFFTLLFIGMAALSTVSGQQHKPSVFEGKVTCNGKGISGVVVTNGISVTQTDVKGNYSLNGCAESEYIYISSPAGYTVPVKESVPQFFQELANENKGKNTANFQLKKVQTNDTKHAFVAWADPQVKTEKEALQAKEVANDLKTLIERNSSYTFHGMGCGDIVGDNPSLYSNTKETLSSLNIPFYHTIGNHDLYYSNRSNESAAKVFKNNFGPDYYSFNRGEIHYVVLNDVFYIGRDYFYIGYLPEQQLSWLEKDLSFVEHGKTVVVVLHIPTALNQEDIRQFSYNNISTSVTNKQALYKILEPYQAHIISGHTHVSGNVVITPSIFEHNISSVCGAWWQGPYAQDGTPKGYAIFEANGSELTWYFKSFGYEKNYQFRAYALGENPEQKEYITANVWNWDPAWQIYWYENGQKMGEMEAYAGRDPGTVNAYADKEKLDYKWIEAAETKHLFRAKPQNPSAKITVKIIDRFGNSYDQDL